MCGNESCCCNFSLDHVRLFGVVQAWVEELNWERTESGAEVGAGFDWVDHVMNAVKGEEGDGCSICDVLVTIHCHY